MSVFDFFRKLFVGVNESVPKRPEPEFRNDFRNPIWESYESDDDDDNDFRSPFGGGSFSFNMYTDPLQMHRYFEQQVQELLKNFFVPESFQDIDSFFGSGFDQFSGVEQSPFENFHQLLPPSQPLQPALEEPEKKDSKSLREQLLKPEFRSIQSQSDKVDTVLDGKIDTDDIVRALDKKDSVVPIWTPNEYEKSLVPNRDSFFFSSGKSVTSRIIRRPDGTVEREEIVRNSDGSETKTVTRSLGEHEYSITTHKDASGIEKKSESFKNIDPEKIEDFNKAWNGLTDYSRPWWSWWGDNRKPPF